MPVYIGEPASVRARFRQEAAERLGRKLQRTRIGGVWPCVNDVVRCRLTQLRAQTITMKRRIAEQSAFHSDYLLLFFVLLVRVGGARK